MPRVLRLHQPIGPSGLSIDTIPLDEPSTGEVRILVSAFALNWGDMDLMNNNYTVDLETLPTRIGDDIVGIVDAVGEGVSTTLVGQRVCTLSYFHGAKGMHGEFAIVAAKYVVPAYATHNDSEACSFWTQYLTAYYPLVTQAQLQAGHKILITAATSSAGLGAIKIANMLGVETICTTRRAENTDFLKKMGADHVVVTGVGEIASQINTLTGDHGVNMVFDPIGGTLVSDYAQALAQGAIVVIYGGLSGEATILPELALTARNATMRFFSVQNYNANDTLREQAIRFIQSGLQSGELTPLVDREYPFEKFMDAYHYMGAARSSHGKIVIKIT